MTGSPRSWRAPASRSTPSATPSPPAPPRWRSTRRGNWRWRCKADRRRAGPLGATRRLPLRKASMLSSRKPLLVLEAGRRRQPNEAAEAVVGGFGERAEVAHQLAVVTERVFRDGAAGEGAFGHADAVAADGSQHA